MAIHIRTHKNKWSDEIIKISLMKPSEKIKAAAAEIENIMDMDMNLDMSELEPMINQVLNEYDIFIPDLDLFYDRINRMDINSVIIKNIIEELWEQ